MHGITSIFGYAIVIAFGAALLTASASGWTTVKTALFVVCVMFVAAMAWIVSVDQATTFDAVVITPMTAGIAAVGLIGAVPGAGVGRWLREYLHRLR